MADRVEAFSVSIPAGTQQNAPQTSPLTFNLGIVTDVEILVPPGCSGLVGFRLQHSQETVIPYNRAQWIVADNDTLHWPLRNFPVGSAWGLQAYNLDVYPHTLYLRFLVDEVSRETSLVATIVDIAPTAPAELEPALEEVA